MLFQQLFSLTDNFDSQARTFPVILGKLKCRLNRFQEDLLRNSLEMSAATMAVMQLIRVRHPGLSGMLWWSVKS